ncbi:glyoxylase-like metal-dependent hydrolase (beta-lactamase superfamily II) [Rheinheimera pacifica]|uniref:MBL fold metallo-hydrolase n=1 Tax=Rheinheimera pacifica TaxID=173990 RepID=UPI002862C923|nr:MBL fold metallo-hydrolase [Rheinheimera pacifica]MDR6981585.1 glyoxylase-like metal-dependent hydrolase (beta-lactamase superfamily II) [Rheinheimera pacifica]
MKLSLATALVLLLAAAPLQADRFKDVQVEETKLADNLYMLSGAGGNMATLIAGDKVLLVDTQYAELAGKIKIKLLQLSANKPLTTLVNTHLHGDHVGGNSALAANIDIIAHNNVLSRLKQDAKFPRNGLPKTTFSDQLSLHLNGQTVRLDYMPPSHTDGDIVVWFEQANAVHFGDLLFEGRFPFIDVSNGGSVKGYIDNTRTLIGMLNEQTKVIPGHGQLTDKAGVQRSLDMMEATLAVVQGYKAAGMTEQQAVDKGLGQQWQSWHWNFITEERWIKTLYHADVSADVN